MQVRHVVPLPSWAKAPVTLGTWLAKIACIGVYARLRFQRCDQCLQFTNVTQRGCACIADKKSVQMNKETEAFGFPPDILN